MLKYLIFSLVLEGGYQPHDYTLILNEVPAHAEYGRDNSFYLEIAPKVDMGPVYLSGAMTTETVFPDDDNAYFGQPYQTQYDVEVGLNIRNITIGAAHMCSHSTFIPSQIFNQHASMDDSNTRLFIRAKLTTEAIQ